MAIAVAAVAHIPMKVVHDQTYVNLGGYLARNDRPADALPFLQKAVALDPDDYHARMYYGMVLCRFERTADCVTQFQAAERIDPASVDAPLYAARAQAQGGDFQSALVSLEKALRIANANGQADRAAELTEIIRQTKLAISSR
jgi:tetratricopeptide (TPR) repeat protein